MNQSSANRRGRAWSAIALATAACSVACGGAQETPASRAAATSAGEATATAPAGDVPLAAGDELYLVAASIDGDWLGGAWAGSPYRLVESGEAPTPGACRPGHAAGVNRSFSPADAITAPGLRAEHVAIDVDEWRDIGACDAPTSWLVVGLGVGTVLSWEGPPAAALDPGEVIAAGGRLVAIRGWTVESGTWTRAPLPVVAHLVPGASAAGRMICAERDGPDAAEALAGALLYERLASPGMVADATRHRALVEESIGGAAAALLQRAVRTGPTDGAGTDAPLFDEAACANSEPWLVAAVAAGLRAPEAVPATDDVGPGVRAFAAAVALAHAPDTAARLAASAAERSPDFGPAAMVRAMSTQATGGSDRIAAAAYETASEDPILVAAAAYERGLIAEDSGDPEAATGWFTLAHESDDEFAAPTNALGFLAFERGEVEAARHWFAEAVARDPDHAGAYNNLGYIAETVDRDARAARAWYTTALEVDPRSASAAYNLGNILERWHGQLVRARELYVLAAELDPNHLDAREALAALDARPTASLELLAGTWTGVDDDGATVTLTVTGTGGTALVRRPPGGEADAVRFDPEPTWVRGPQIAFSAETGVRIVEFVANDTVVVYRESDPVGSRVPLDRLGGGMAALALPRYALRTNSATR